MHSYSPLTPPNHTCFSHACDTALDTYAGKHKYTLFFTKMESCLRFYTQLALFVGPVYHRPPFRLAHFQLFQVFSRAAWNFIALPGRDRRAGLPQAACRVWGLDHVGKVLHHESRWVWEYVY